MSTRSFNRPHRSLLPVLVLIAASTAAAANQIDPEEPIDLALERAPLVEILRSFAGISGSRLDLDPQVEGLVTLELKSIPWRQALDRICADHRLDCQILAGEPPVLRVRPRLEPAGGAPPPPPAGGVRDRRVEVRFFAPGSDRPVAGTARFSWVVPIRTFDAGDAGERWLARLSWIPFGPGLDLVVPTLVRCAGGGVETQVLDPIRLPLEEPATRRWRGARIELAAAADAAVHGSAGGSTMPRDCGGAGATMIRAAFRHAGAAEETTLGLEAFPGTYLLLTPPTGDGRPAAAVLALGADLDGGQRIAVLTPGADGAVALERRTLPAGDELRERITAPDGRDLELRLRSAGPD